MIFKLYPTIFYLHLQVLEWDDGATGEFVWSWLQQNCIIKRNSLKHFYRVSNIHRPSSIAPIRVPFKGRWKLASHGNGKKQEKEQIQSNLIWKGLELSLLDSLVLRVSVGKFYEFCINPDPEWWCNERETNKHNPSPMRHLFNFLFIFFSPVA